MTISDFFLSLTQAAKYAGAGLATIGVVGAVIGIVFLGLLLAISRNPQKEQRLAQLTLLAYALSEAKKGLLTIMMAFLILYVCLLNRI